MSLGDELRFLRAMQAGIEPDKVERIIGLPRYTMTDLEDAPDKFGGDETLAQVAGYFSVEPNSLRAARKHSRVALDIYLKRMKAQRQTAILRLRGGSTVVGSPYWWDRAVVSIGQPEGENLIVMRHAVISWEMPEQLVEASSVHP